jgi:hypothetical protein
MIVTPTRQNISVEDSYLSGFVHIEGFVWETTDNKAHLQPVEKPGTILSL